MDFFYLTLGILGVWRITHLVQAEDGPWDLVIRLRHAVGSRFWGRLLDCFYCLSLWIAVPFAWLLGPDLRHCFLLWLALSGGAILLERATQPTSPSSAPYWKEEDSRCHAADRKD
jgi:hypothetical protein